MPAPASQQVSLDADGKPLRNGEIVAQARQVFENRRMQLETNGATTADILKVTAFVTGITLSTAGRMCCSAFFAKRAGRLHGRCVRVTGAFD